MKIQEQVHLWIRKKDREAWQALREKGIPPSEILSRGIELVYEEELKNERNGKDAGQKPTVRQ